jgi:hypothetical protein
MAEDQPPASSTNFTRIIIWEDLLLDWMFRPAGYLWLSLLLLSFHRAFAKRDGFQSQLPRMSRAKFIAVWIATAVVMISGAFVLAWTSFALWFNPWFTGRWP